MTAEQVRLYAESYLADPQTSVDEWGDLGAASEREGQRVAQALDVEEDRLGLSW